MSLFREIATNLLAKFNDQGSLIGFALPGGKKSLIPALNEGETALVFNNEVHPFPGVPYPFNSSALDPMDNGATLVCFTPQTATVNADLPTGFGCAFKGAVSFSGTASVTDLRTTGSSNPWCALVQTASNTYDVLGTKA